MDLSIQLIVKVQQFEDKRIEANRLWNVKELKGRLSEIYPTVSRTKKFRAKLEKNFSISVDLCKTKSDSGKTVDIIFIQIRLTRVLHIGNHHLATLTDEM